MSPRPHPRQARRDCPPTLWSACPLAAARRLRPSSRYYARLAADHDHEAWLLTWLPGQGTPWHDHGGSAGSFVILQGVLTEEVAGYRSARDLDDSRRATGPAVTLAAGDQRTFGQRHLHRVTNVGPDPAVSLHVYAPKLTVMNNYRETDGLLEVIEEARSAPTGDRRPPSNPRALDHHRVVRTIAQVLAEARSQLHRLTPAEAEEALAGVRSSSTSARSLSAEHGELPFALPVERNVLEWRFDPASDAALPVASHDLEVVVLCQEGYTSSLAAAALQQLGIHRATDVIGGYAAWRAWQDTVAVWSGGSDNRSTPAAVLVRLATMTSSDLWDEETAARYDEDARPRCSRPQVLGPTVDFLAGWRARPGAGARHRHGPGRHPARGPRRAGDRASSCRSRWSASCGARSTRPRCRSSSATWPPPASPGEFALVYLVCNTIANLRTQGEQVECFRNAARHLRPGGRFVIELWVPPLRRFPPGQVAVPFDVSDAASRLRHLRPGDAAGHLAPLHDRRRRSIRYGASNFRYVWPAECDLMAQLAGLELEQRIADWDGSPFTADSESHVSVWRKR